MFSLGCIQSLSCHTDMCPTGVATQDLIRNRALVVADKKQHVLNYHHATLLALSELIAAAGLDHPGQIRPIHFSHRMTGTEVLTYARMYPSLWPGELIDGTADERFREAWEMAQAETFSEGVRLQTAATQAPLLSRAGGDPVRRSLSFNFDATEY